MRIHKEGFASIGITVLVLAALNFVAQRLNLGHTWILVLRLASIVLFLFIVLFSGCLPASFLKMLLE
jgi:hypothetical protein